MASALTLSRRSGRQLSAGKSAPAKSPGTAGFSPKTTSAGEAWSSEWKEVRLAKSVHGRQDIHLDLWVSPMANKVALRDAFRSLWILSTEPKLEGE